MKKTPEEAIEILNELGEDANQWVVENSERKKTAGGGILLMNVNKGHLQKSLNAWKQNNMRGKGQTPRGIRMQRQQYQPQQGQQGNQSILEEMFKSFIAKADTKFENQVLLFAIWRSKWDRLQIKFLKEVQELYQSPKEKSRESQVETKESHETKKVRKDNRNAKERKKELKCASSKLFARALKCPAARPRGHIKSTTASPRAGRTLGFPAAFPHGGVV
ncbi:hypothetical protein KY285_007951 [Solanum tuberosum]|nr:hypothetical protein KY285_007951 [Solanum tuberosum]